MSKITNLLKNISRRFIFIGIIILIIGAYFIFTNKKALPLIYTQTKKQNIREEISGSGTLTGENIANIRFKTTGKISFINVAVGDKVFKGQVIAELDKEELLISLRQAENTLRDKRAIVDRVHDELKDHQKDETFTQRQTRTTAEVAQDNAYDSMLSAQKAVREAVIYSPISGIITQVLQLSHQIVNSSDIIAQVVDTSGTYFETDLDEADIEKIKLGLFAEIELDAYPNKKFEGNLNRIIPQIKTTSSGATIISIRIKLKDAMLNFINGLTGQALITINESSNVITIPQEALREDNVVFVERDGELRRQSVKVGIRSDTDIEIKNGLVENEKILLNPPSKGTRISQNSSVVGILTRFLGGNSIREAVRGR
ncbi:MAG: efflux RND transporter periplasmic adaptor subunit [Candidatus Levybacteria bacterium]|nr:efflux RND transporter periplasmic adaptor subunit [Candidatus Levybacteria bacterium]